MWNKESFHNWTIIYKAKEEYVPYTHCHYDFLHFILLDNNKPIFIDSGRSTYDSKNIHYDSFLPEHHNSLLIDNVSYKPYNISKYPPSYYQYECISNLYKSNENMVIKLQTNGFNRLKKNLNLIRTITLSESSVTIHDSINDSLQYKIQHYFHINPWYKITNHDSSIYFNKSYCFACDKVMNNFLINEDHKLMLNSERYGNIKNKNYISMKNNISKDKPIIYSIKKL